MDFISARQNMVDSQVRTNDVTDLPLQKAMRRVARERFVAPGRAFAAYAEIEVEIAPGRWLMKPRDLGKLLQAVHPRSGERALAIAAPYAGALLADMGLSVTAQESDHRAALVVETALADAGVPLKIQDLATPAGGPYDLIVSEGAVAETPRAWLDALAPGGRLAIVERDGPVGRALIWVNGPTGPSRREAFDAIPPVLAGFERAPTFQF